MKNGQLVNLLED